MSIIDNATISEIEDDMPADWDESLGSNHHRVKPYIFICGTRDADTGRVISHEAHTRIMQLDPTNAEEIATVVNSSIRLDEGDNVFCAFVISMDLSYGMQIYQGDGKRVLTFP